MFSRKHVENALWAYISFAIKAFMRQHKIEQTTNIENMFWLDSSFVVANTQLTLFTFMHFSRRFYPKRLTVHSGYTFVLSVCVFPGNRTHNLCAANAMLYHWATGIYFYSVNLTKSRYFGILTIFLGLDCVYRLFECKLDCIVGFLVIKNVPQ